MKTKTHGFRKGMAGLALVGVTALGVGVAGVASAGAAPATASTSTTATTCQAQLRMLRAQWWDLQGKIDLLQRERNEAIAHGRYQLAAQLERAILDLQARQAAVHAKIVVLEQRCG